MKIECAVAAAFVSLAFASQALAVLRPMFPIKPMAPSDGELIVIGDELVLRLTKKTSDASPKPCLVASPWTAGIVDAHQLIETRRLASATSSSF